MYQFETIHQIINQQADQRPDNIALLSIDGRQFTYAELADQVQTIVTRLNNLGIGRNDAVGVVLPNGPKMAVTFLAVASGATFAPLNPAYRADEYEFFLSDLKASALLTSADLESEAEEVASRLGIPVIYLEEKGEGEDLIYSFSGESNPLTSESGLASADDVALILHTSGTTSRPKMVPLSHRNLAASAIHISKSLGLESSDRCLNIMPLFHIHGLMAALLASINAGGSVVCSPGFDAPRFFGWLNQFRPTWYTAVPTMHQAILSRAESNLDVIERAQLRFIRSSSSSLPPVVMHDLERIFQAPVIEAYGMTEASHQMASNPLPPGERKPGSVGVAAGPQVAIMAEDTSDLLPAGRTGEIVIRGPNVTLGYANNPAANAAAYSDGWFRTGDQGQFDQDGYLYITGRLKEIINRGGEKVAPREIDEVLLSHPAIDQALAFAVADEVLGEDVAAAIVLKEDMVVSEQDIRRFVSQHLADFKVPRIIVFLDQIPKGSTGKLQRIGLAEKLGISVRQQLRPEDQPEIAFPTTETEKLLFEIWSEILDTSDFGVNHAFTEVGGDSILATKLAMSIRKTMNIDLPLVEFYEAATIKEQAELIEMRLAD